MLDDRLRRGVRVCGRFGTVGRVYMQCRLRVHIDNDNVVCGYRVNMLDDRLRRGLFVRGGLGAASDLYL